MIASFIITFRETLEAALIIGIILSFLIRTKQQRYNKTVYSGIFFGIVASVIGAFIFNRLAGGFEGRSEEIFEGVTMFIGALLLTTMILWMMKQKRVVAELELKVAKETLSSHKFGLFFLTFVSVLREGVETVIFLGATSFVSTDNNLLGAMFGILVAALLGYFIFAGSKRIKIKKFFNITSLILILFAAGLIAHGIHEFQEAKLIPTIKEHVWDINPEVNADGSYPLFHEKGNIGSVLKGLFGYNGNPSLIEILSYIFYLIIVFFLWYRIQKSETPQTRA